jgi:D-alanine-D-alanine ligase
VEVSLPGEVIAHGEWYDYETKYSAGGMDLVVPAAIGEGETAAVRELAARAFVLGGCAGLARCDFFVTADGAVLVNEINTMPGFTETSVYARLWEASGLDYPGLCDRLVQLARERHKHSRSYEF